jgi:hypothetical protein
MNSKESRIESDEDDPDVAAGDQLRRGIHASPEPGFFDR